MEPYLTQLTLWWVLIFFEFCFVCFLWVYGQCLAKLQLQMDRTWEMCVGGILTSLKTPFPARFLTELLATDIILSWIAFIFTQMIKVLSQGKKKTKIIEWATINLSLTELLTGMQSQWGKDISHLTGMCLIATLLKGRSLLCIFNQAVVPDHHINLIVDGASYKYLVTS